MSGQINREPLKFVVKITPSLMYSRTFVPNSQTAPSETHIKSFGR